MTRGLAWLLNIGASWAKRTKSTTEGHGFKSYEDLLRRNELLDGIARGERAFSGGRVVTHAEAMKRLGLWT